MGRNTNFKHRSTNGTTTLGAVGEHVRLWAIVINTKGAAANTCTVTDVASGVVVAVIDTVTPADANFSYLGLGGRDGFTVALATGTAADITIVYE